MVLKNDIFLWLWKFYHVWILFPFCRLRLVRRFSLYSVDIYNEFKDCLLGISRCFGWFPFNKVLRVRTSIDNIRENGFELTKKRSRRYPAKTIADADYADDIALLANTPNQAETLLHSLERAAAGIGLHVNAHKTEFMCFNQKGDISTLDGTSLKLVDKFTYLGSSITSTEKTSTHG